MSYIKQVSSYHESKKITNHLETMPFMFEYKIYYALFSSILCKFYHNYDEILYEVVRKLQNTKY